MSARLTVLEKNRLVDGLLLAAIPAGLLLFAAFLRWHFLPGTLGVHLAVISAVVRFGVARENARARPVARTVRASAQGVRVDDRFIPRRTIVEGWYQPKLNGESTVRLFDKGKRILFEAKVEDEDQARSILRALGLDASQKRVQFRVASPVATSQFRVFGSCLALAMVSSILGNALHVAWNPLLFFGPMLLGGLLASVPGKITVGLDGILQQWFFWKRFTPLHAIRNVMTEGEREIRIAMIEGKDQVIAVSTQKRWGGVYTERRNMIVARMREAMAASRAPGRGVDVTALVARGTRSLEEWKKGLAALESGDSGYRQAALREEDLWRIVEDPRASSDARAGAAMLLRKGLDEAGRARVRVAAETTASPHLRIALEKASDGAGDDEALAALDDIEVARASTSPLRAGASGGR